MKYRASVVQISEEDQSDCMNSQRKVLNIIILQVVTETKGAALERLRESKMTASDSRREDRRVRGQLTWSPDQEKNVEFVEMSWKVSEVLRDKQ